MKMLTNERLTRSKLETVGSDRYSKCCECYICDKTFLHTTRYRLVMVSVMESNWLPRDVTHQRLHNHRLLPFR